MIQQEDFFFVPAWLWFMFLCIATCVICYLLASILAVICIIIIFIIQYRRKNSRTSYRMTMARSNYNNVARNIDHGLETRFITADHFAETDGLGAPIFQQDTVPLFNSHTPVRSSNNPYKQQTDQGEESENEESYDYFSDKLNNAISKVSSQLEKSGTFLLDELSIDRKEPIGVGSSGQVFKAKYLGTTVAVKRCLIVDLLEDPLLDFLRETQLLSSLRHQNIVTFIGASIKPPHFYIITEYCENGSLDKLKSSSTIPQKSLLSTLKIDLYAKVKWMLDAAHGMLYLSKLKPPIIHRDLKLGNLLVDSAFNVKISDFGVSKVIDRQSKHQNQLTSNIQVGTVESESPEVIQYGRYSLASDVYAFGIMLYEYIYSDKELYPGLSVFELKEQVMSNNLRPPIPDLTELPSLWQNDYAQQIATLNQLIQKCWDQQPENRVGFVEICSTMETLLATIKPEENSIFYTPH